MDLKSYIDLAIEQCEKMQRKIVSVEDEKMKKEFFAIYEERRDKYITLLKLFETVISKFPVREQIALREYYLKRKTQKEVSDVMQLSERQTARIIRNAASKIDNKAIQKHFIQQRELVPRKTREGKE